MGILDKVLGLGTSAATNKAAGTGMAYRQAVGGANDATLRGLSNNAAQYAQNAVQNGWNDLRANTEWGTDAVRQGSAGALSTLMAGRDAAVGTTLGSNAAYAPYQAGGGAATAMLANSYGLNGAAGNAAATGAFQAGPGYQWQVDQATDAASRKAASLGMAASGNTLDAITRLGSNLANQEYGNWQSGLAGLGAQGLAANNAVTANNGQAAGYQYGAGSAGAQLQQQTGGLLASLYQNQGNQDAALNGNLGNALMGNQNTLASNLVNNTTGTANAVNGMSMDAAGAQDRVTSTNNGILSNMLGTIGSGFMTGTGSGKALSSALMRI